MSAGIEIPIDRDEPFLVDLNTLLDHQIYYIKGSPQQ